MCALEHDAAALRTSMARADAALRDAARGHAVAEAAAAEKKAALAAATRAMLLADKQAAKKRAAAEKTSPAAVALKEEATRANRRLKAAESALATQTAEHQAAQRAVSRLQEDLDLALEAQREYEKQAEKEAAGPGGQRLQLAGDQVAAYHACKAAAGAKSFKLTQDRAVLQAAQQADAEALAHLQSNGADVEARVARLEADRDKARARATQLIAAVAAARAELSELKKHATEAADAQRRARLRLDQATSQLERVEAALRDARADRAESEHEAARAAAVDRLKALVPGVHGRLSDLVQATQRKYHLPLAVVLGRNLDAVIVADERAARECIQYLKDQRLPAATFVPLATIKAMPPDARLRAAGSLGDSARLLLDVVQYEPALERALWYALGGAVVADTLEAARPLAYGGAGPGGERLKVVTLDGTLLAKSGLITGGNSGGMEARAARFDREAVAALKAERAALSAEAAALTASTGRAATLAEGELAGRVAALERTLGYMQSDASVTADRASALEAERATLVAETSRRGPELARLSAEIAKRSKAIEKLTGRINEIADGVFADFSRQVGVANIREYEEGHLRRVQASAEERARLGTQVSRLRTQLDYEARRDAAAALSKAQQAVAKAVAEVDALAAKSAAGTAAAAAAAAELSQLTSQAAAAKSAADEAETEAKELVRAAREATAELGRRKKAKAAAETSAEQLAARLTDLLAAAAMEQVELPAGPTGTVAGAVVSATAPMEVDCAEVSGAASALAALPAPGRYDYTALSRKLHTAAAGSTHERAAVMAALRSDLEERTAALAAVAPNHRALEQYEAVKAREVALSEELESAKAAAKAATDAFGSVREQRHRRFMQCFTHVEKVIDSIYKDLTRSAKHPSGGTAYLSLEHLDDPFLHGVKFTAMPPAKRFRDIDLLSGGEKTVAALALLFAVHSYRPSPFFILDEVDANLDNENIAKVAQYIRGRSAGGGTASASAAPFQSVVISLKDSFYDKADALIGVCRDPEQHCSSTYTLDLTQYD